ncbi:TerC family protein [Tautonia sociabilis]|uniref:TerC family protein n=1 Tax=Tautonia sociabilis TaxID=2080755 RepID=UPI00131505C8|nr:TerC family protein [Tautonia sociabilis]
MEPSLLAFASLFQIILINVVLSGDNALVIAMASRHLPPHQRKAAMLWGGAMAITLRLVLTLAVSFVMLVPGVRFLGALLLVGIACKLLQDEDQSAEHGCPMPTGLRTAVFRIAVADIVMSLDNVVAIAGVSDSNPVLLVVGLAISIVMILAFSQVIFELMARMRWIVYAGTGVLALTAAGMMLHDLETLGFALARPTLAESLPPWASWGFRGAVVGACLTSSRWWPKPAPAAEPA